MSDCISLFKIRKFKHIIFWLKGYEFCPKRKKWITYEDILLMPRCTIDTDESIHNNLVGWERRIKDNSNRRMKYIGIMLALLSALGTVIGFLL